MSKNKDGLAKNISVVQEEFEDFALDQKWNWKRLVGLEDNIFHIGVAFISTTFQTLPRTLTYITLVVGVGYALRGGINLLG